MTTLVDGGAIPVGTILAFGGQDSIPDGFLLCNGALINRNDYADLFAVIGTRWGSTTGTNFRVPTTQGLLLRGRANGSGFDENRNTRTAIQSGGSTGDNVGSFQNDRIQNHNHNLNANRFLATQTPSSSGAVQKAHPNFFTLTTNNTDYLTRANNMIQDVNVNAGGGGSQTVGKNVYVNFIIKF